MEDVHNEKKGLFYSNWMYVSRDAANARRLVDGLRIV